MSSGILPPKFLDADADADADAHIAPLHIPHRRCAHANDD